MLFSISQGSLSVYKVFPSTFKKGGSCTICPFLIVIIINSLLLHSLNITYASQSLFLYWKNFLQKNRNNMSLYMLFQNICENLYLKLLKIPKLQTL